MKKFKIYFYGEDAILGETNVIFLNGFMSMYEAIKISNIISANL